MKIRTILLSIMLVTMLAFTSIAQVSGYKMPYKDGMSYQISGVRTAHTPINGIPRQAIDIALPYDTSVLAMKSGKVVTAAYNVSGGGHLVIVDTNDQYCSVYLHLSRITKISGAIQAGEEVGKSGRGGPANAAHLHIAVYTKKAGSSSCDGYGDGPKQREAVIIFSEAGRQLNYNDYIKSQNVGSRISRITFFSSSNGSVCQISAQVYGITNANGTIWAQAIENGTWNCAPSGCSKGNYTSSYTNISMSPRPGGITYSYHFRIGSGNETKWLAAPLKLSSTCQVQ